MKNLLMAILVASIASSAFAVNQGDVAPPWSGKDLITGQTVSFPEVLNGKPAVILFWATWCPYCKAFMPRAAEIQAEYEDAGVQIIGLNHKERGYGDPAAYAKSLGFRMVAIADADAIGDAWRIDFIPGLLIVDGDGNVVYRRRSTDLPAGRKVSEIWASEVRSVLDKMLQ